jgi:hypothetical protein
MAGRGIGRSGDNVSKANGYVQDQTENIGKVGIVIPVFVHVCVCVGE